MSWFATLQADDLDALNKYVTGTPIRTPQAQALRDQWIAWFDGLSYSQRSFDRPTYDTARNKKLDFNLANATSEAERAEIRKIASEGLSSEEMQGEADRRMTGGTYSGKDGGIGIAPGFGSAALGTALLAAFAGGAYLARKLK